MKTSSIAAIAASLVFVLVQNGAAQKEPVRLIASNGVKAVLEEALPQAEKAIGCPVSAQFGTTADFMKKISAGADFDLVILASEAIDELNKEGKTASATRADLSQAGVGIGIRAGAPKPDIRTPAALTQTLLHAKQITYAPNGASTPAIEKMLGSLGIAEKVKPKTLLLQGSDLTLAAVADGRADMVLTLISEILPAHGVELLGPLPSQFQQYISFSAAVNSHTNNGDAAKALIKFLKSPAVAPVYKAKGMEAR